MAGFRWSAARTVLQMSSVDSRLIDMEIDEIVPDDRDWTWVLERKCPECGFDAGTFDATGVGAAIRTNASTWVSVLDRDVSGLRERRVPNRWSDLEYAAHVRDVYRLYLERLQLMLRDDDPLFANWDQDQTAVEQRYADQEPVLVSSELVESAHALADAFDKVSDDQWSRPGRRSDGAAFTVDSFARYLIHDPIHHLWDVAD
jgi:DinB superfamily